MTPTPSQTVGPFFAIGLARREQHVLDAGGIELHGRLLDGNGDPVPDGVIELYDPATRAWGRSATDSNGVFRFLAPREASRLWAYVFARGLLRHQLTAIDLPHDGPSDIYLQGERETTFFAV
jgi:protocatechuate 3,4-dioxygenase, alpha subunit